jgi:hypothetical protein
MGFSTLQSLSDRVSRSVSGPRVSSMLSTLSRSNFTTRLSRRSNGCLSKVVSRYDDTRNTFFSPGFTA